MRKIRVSLQLDAWLLAGLDVLSDRLPLRPGRTALLKLLLVEGLQRYGITEDTPAVREAVEERTAKRAK